jgi:hypothetical protein
LPRVLLFQQQPMGCADGCFLLSASGLGCRLGEADSKSSENLNTNELGMLVFFLDPLYIGSTNKDGNKAEAGVCWLPAAGLMRLLADPCGFEHPAVQLEVRVCCSAVTPPSCKNRFYAKVEMGSNSSESYFFTCLSRVCLGRKPKRP